MNPRNFDTLRDEILRRTGLDAQVSPTEEDGRSQTTILSMLDAQVSSPEEDVRSHNLTHTISFMRMERHERERQTGYVTSPKEISAIAE